MKAPLLALLLSLPVMADDLSSVAAMKSAADAFLGSLDEAKREKAVFAFDGDERENFKFTPRERTGLPLKEMSETQNAAAMKLLEAALSEKGKLKAMQIITLEGVLREMEKNPTYRDPGKYYVSIFGKPGDEKGWGWKFEGHHLALNYTVVGDKVAVTPSFFAANPAEVREGEHKGLRVLAAEEDLAMALANVLIDGGKKDVIFSDKAPGEILTAENRKATALEPVGLLASEMSDGQKQALRELITEYVGRHRKDLAEADLAKIDKAGFDKVRFGWAGGTKRGEAWYYRVQGPTFLMEAANTQNNANHIHATWRSFEGDFGRDMLSEHYHQHEEDGGHHH
ncbi:DUF3500 domain-containing protein [Luteolibacter flavescens]|uniref:DUF3500 domain-containing protein n=1 Tax=Luteolibacter flavescens TaxID=1859460 RepID=A0ABT3FJ96_9BACT|nr:DUF3500 domain-containing protein [Luteolibacter flavescens]MCW1883644.1 DUF3500 domain-containing protein [Luteolibacter flavescens]